MKICIINASPKVSKSFSDYILKEIKKFLNTEEIFELHFEKSKPQDSDIEIIKDMDILLIAFPLYVDTLPSHLISCLSQIEKENINKDIKVYAICNCGFFEGDQCDIALKNIECWCNKTGFIWQEGIGIGGGPLYTKLDENSKLTKDMKMSLRLIANDILNERGCENSFISPILPRFIYKFLVERLWRSTLKKNGLKKKELFRRI